MDVPLSEDVTVKLIMGSIEDLKETVNTRFVDLNTKIDRVEGHAIRTNGRVTDLEMAKVAVEAVRHDRAERLREEQKETATTVEHVNASRNRRATVVSGVFGGTLGTLVSFLTLLITGHA